MSLKSLFELAALQLRNEASLDDIVSTEMFDKCVDAWKRCIPIFPKVQLEYTDFIFSRVGEVWIWGHVSGSDYEYTLEIHDNGLVDIWKNKRFTRSRNRTKKLELV